MRFTKRPSTLRWKLHSCMAACWYLCSRSQLVYYKKRALPPLHLEHGKSPSHFLVPCCMYTGLELCTKPPPDMMDWLNPMPHMLLLVLYVYWFNLFPLPPTIGMSIAHHRQIQLECQLECYCWIQYCCCCGFGLANTVVTEVGMWLAWSQILLCKGYESLVDSLVVKIGWDSRQPKFTQVLMGSEQENYKQWFLNTHTFVYSNVTKSRVSNSTLTFVGKYKDMRVNMDDKELVKCLIPHWKWERLFYSF